MKKTPPAIHLALLTIVLLLIATGSRAQKAPTTPKVITGKITNATTNEPLEEVTVQLKGKSVTAVTNEQGIYSISVDNVQGAILVFSFVGYTEKEVKLNTTTTIY